VRNTVIESFDDFEREISMMSDLGRRPVFSFKNQLEAHLFDVAEKHGVIDEMIDAQWDEQEEDF
jgi:hypothetical protein